MSTVIPVTLETTPLIAGGPPRHVRDVILPWPLPPVGETLSIAGGDLAQPEVWVVLARAYQYNLPKDPNGGPSLQAKMVVVTQAQFTMMQRGG